ncbi:YesN/AraC family two-component response regulator [Parabacteroides sp. PF5-5]|uniref:helix-turn-helix domain-containing protein n=1 Tax=unclassified Parabacteroides TaxID=2649774 RepID=UPI0024745A5D|nr:MULTISPECIES: helix-turn-helix domain-containing protein [unclassified Parabacteroides]MDH6303597.1 YesN/AraC family two-component response regulator [Parabacteroides sp. PH5-39]MDH6314919.1 YesN/AraC family two-component response regulator [Parabacteroides sp. PF5-13]MDH6318256.1 YesN/AraC family two-component response regulator [Parabacteroides sp. PH5-13]MDH6321811.1 YesN/AraC family two-component response regulator [Parabacteroides sp. PH5-8]MDH6325935.1 YesN/AraC family two-component r
MSTIKKISLDDIWTPPVNDFTPLKPSGNEVIDNYGEQVRARRHDHLRYFAQSMGLTLDELNNTMKSFTDYTAASFKDYLVSYDAQWMLLHSMMSIKEIAKKLGFSNGSVFYSFFRRMKGISPTEYRKGHRKVEKTVDYKITYF